MGHRGVFSGAAPRLPAARGRGGPNAADSVRCGSAAAPHYCLLATRQPGLGTSGASGEDASAALPLAQMESPQAGGKYSLEDFPRSIRLSAMLSIPFIADHHSKAA